MRTRSTGLGRTELISKCEHIVVNDRFLIISSRSTAPVKWHVRIALNPQDVREIIGHMFKFSVVKHILWCLITRKAEGKVPEF